MKAKIFKLSLIAMIAMAPLYKCVAQQATVSPAVPATAAPAAKPTKKVAQAGNYSSDNYGQGNYSSDNYAQGSYSSNYYSSDTGRKKAMATDSVYRKKMKELNSKMNELHQQMNALRNEQIKEQTVARRDMTERMNRDRSAAEARNFDRAFSVPRKGFSFDNDKELQDKIKSGEVKELTKAYTKSYPVSKSDQLSIENTYGKVTVNTWDKNEFKVDVEIKADENTQADAQKLLDDVSIADSKDGSTITFKTNFAEKNHSSWSNSNDGKYTIHRVQINYTVYMPAKNALSISNRFGATTLPDFDGKLTISQNYGSFTAKKLSNPSNDISTKFTNNTIEELNGSSLSMSYGSLDLGTTDNLKADLNNTPAKIASIKTSGTLNIRYGGVKIASMDKNLKNLSVTTSFAPVTVGIAGDPNLDFDISIKNTYFDYGTHNVTITEKTPTDNDRGYSSTKTYKGHIGKGSTDKVITIKSNYGSVKFD